MVALHSERRIDIAHFSSSESQDATRFDLAVRGRLALPGREPAAGAGRVAEGPHRGGRRPRGRAARRQASSTAATPWCCRAAWTSTSTRAAPPRRASPPAREPRPPAGVTTVVDMPYDHARHGRRPRGVRRQGGGGRARGAWSTSRCGRRCRREGRSSTWRAGGGGCLRVQALDLRHPPGALPARARRPAARRVRGASPRPVGSPACTPRTTRSCARGSAALRAAGRRDAPAHAESRPAVAETEAIARCLELARAAGVPPAPVPRDGGARRGARPPGPSRRRRREPPRPARTTCCSTRTSSRAGAARPKINPPLRPRAEVEALWRRLAAGEVDLISSDHVGWPAERKRGDDVFELASGAPGVELILPAGARRDRRPGAAARPCSRACSARRRHGASASGRARAR